MSKRLPLLGALMLAPVALALSFACGTPAPLKLTIAQAGDFFLYAPLYVAVDGGMFKREGLDVSLVSTGGDDKTWAAVIGGSAKFGVADPTFVVVSGQRGEPGRTIGGIVNGVPFWGVTYHTDIPAFQDGKGLAGHTVATFPEPSTAYALQRQMFLNAGLAPSIRQGAFGTLFAMLNSGQADIALELEPNVSEAVKRGAKVVYSMPEIYGDFAITGLTTTPSILTAEPDLVQRVTCGLQLALDHIQVQPDDSLRILLARFRDLDPAVAKNALGRVTAQGIIPKSLVISDLAWQRAVQLRVDAGQIQKSQNATDYLDNAPAQRAMSTRSCHEK